MGRRLVAGLVGVALLVACSDADPDVVVLSTDHSALSAAELVRAAGAVEGASDVELVGRVAGPWGPAFLVTMNGVDGECIGLFELSSSQALCDQSHGSDAVILSGGDGQVLNLILDTSREGISAIRVTSEDGDLYEVAPLGKLSAITFPQPASGYVVSLMAGEETIYQQSG